MFLILLVMRLLITNTLYPPGDIFGGKITSRILEEVGKKYYVYLYHNHNGSDTLNPQLAWYTGGWNCGWLNNKSVINISLPEAKIDLKQINKTDIFERILLVYYLPEDRILAKSVIREISAVRPVIIQTRNYIIFGTKHFQRKIGAPV